MGVSYNAQKDNRKLTEFQEVKDGKGKSDKGEQEADKTV